MIWTCTNSEERLSDYLDGNLSAEDSASYAAHAAGCAQCGRMLADVGGLLRGMHALEMLPEPPRLAQYILDATLGPRDKTRGWQRWFAWIPVLWQPRFAMGMATVAASFVIVFHTAGITPAKIRKADLSPANLYRTVNRQVHLTYARSAKFVNDLRVVYEIQSRLQPAEEPAPMPAAAPEPERPSHAPGANPQQKSEQKPPRDRSQVRNTNLLAVLLPETLSPYVLDASTRISR
jgi:predicted anti-sigma-YlaC factor YlaD